jgi:hypothetical protein
LLFTQTLDLHEVPFHLKHHYLKFKHFRAVLSESHIDT